jgi:ubiquinone/menaquinone biosynthesis C-methylase UbiE
LSLDTDALSLLEPDFESRFATTGLRRAIAYEQRTVIAVLGPLRPGVMLDVGTGFGRLISFPPPPEVVGIDVSEADLKMAIDRYSGDGSKHFVLATPLSLPFRDSSFDQALGIRVIKFLEDPEAAVSEMADVLRPGGRLVVDISNKFAPAAVLRRLGSWFRIRKPSRAYFSHGDGLRMMAAVGLVPFASKPLYKVDPAVWRSFHSEVLVGTIESLESFLDRSTGPWFLSRYVVIACEKPFSSD